MGPTDLPFAYVINYEKGGWVILAADRRINPVLAYSTEASFSLTEESYPGLLLDWLEEKARFVEYIRSMNIDAPVDFAGQWTKKNIAHTVTANEPTYRDGTTYGNPADCAAQVNDPPAIIKTVGPLLNTIWGQGDGYNNAAPYLYCSTYSNGKAPTGCVTTGIAQIMRYHQYPHTYNWSIMPDQINSSNSSSTGANEIASLMRDVGDAVDMDWGCDGSGANTKDDTTGAFKDHFNYSSANSADFNYDIVALELDSGRPVILSGGRAADYIFFDVPADGHAWVCDGYRLNQKVVFTTYQGVMPPRYFCLTIASLHMNWG